MTEPGNKIVRKAAVWGSILTKSGLSPKLLLGGAAVTAQGVEII